MAIISLRGRLNDRFSFLAKLSLLVVYDRNQVAWRNISPRFKMPCTSGPTEKQNIWTDAEKSKPNEQKQRGKTRTKWTASGWVCGNFRRENNNRLTRRKKKRWTRRKMKKKKKGEGEREKESSGLRCNSPWGMMSFLNEATSRRSLFSEGKEIE